MKKTKFRLTTTRIIMLGFLLAIGIGTFLLCLPISSVKGRPVDFLDAFFVATSAVCVTGLSTVVTAAQWSVFGQAVILLLVQFGGLGIVTVTTVMMLVFGRRIMLSERLLLQEAYNLDSLRGLVRVTKSVVLGTLLVEGIGACLYFLCFVGEYGPTAIWYAIFHAVSAFCNAGLDLLGDSSLAAYATNLWVNLVTIGLIVIGGIGFPVWRDVRRTYKKRREGEIPKGRFFERLSLHSKLAITTSALLVFGGAVLFFLFEYNNPDTIGTMSFPQKLLASLFQSVTTRTAGFQTIPQENFTPASSMLSLIFMFIGGSPSSTAGGVKTVTVAVILLSVISVVRGKRDIEVFQRKIPSFYLKKALAVVSVSIGCVFAATMLVCATQGWNLTEALYETVSALATVGLSCGKTGDLNSVGKVIIILCMYLGRIGPITLAISLQSGAQKGIRKLPESKVMIG